MPRHVVGAYGLAPLLGPAGNKCRQALGGIGGDEAARALWQAALEGARGSNLLSWPPQQSSAIATGREAEREVATSSASAAAVSTAAAAVQQPPVANRTTTATTTTTIQWAAEATTLDRFKYYFQQF